MRNRTPENKHGDSETFPQVAVTDLTDQMELLKSDPSHVSLGVGVRNELREAMIELKLNELLGAIRQQSGHVYLLTWNGNKIPRGAKIEGKEIAWTQNGVANASDGSMMGTYDRLVEWGGDSKKDQAMLVFTLEERLTE